MARTSNGPPPPQCPNLFEGVRVHVSSTEVDRLHRSLGAEAFTHGTDVHFGPQAPGQEVVAHELTHVVQQGAPTVPRQPMDNGMMGVRLREHSAAKR